MHIRFIRNSPDEGPARLAPIVRDLGCTFDEVGTYEADPLETHSPGMSYVVLGGPAGANDDTEPLMRCRALARQCLLDDIPYFGVCLGMQVLGVVAGEDLVRLKRREVGWTAEGGEGYFMRRMKDSSKDSILNGIADEVPVLHLHGDGIRLRSHDDRELDTLAEEMTANVILPAPSDKRRGVGEGARLLAYGQWPTQFISAGPRQFGVQGHIEVDEATIRDWHATDAWLKELDIDRLVDGFRRVEKQLSQTAETLMKNFIRLAAGRAPGR